MRPPVLLAVVLVLQNHKCFACLPKRTKVLTDSFVPVGIQAVNHYKTQLQRYYPYAFTDMCQTGPNSLSFDSNGQNIANDFGATVLFYSAETPEGGNWRQSHMQNHGLSSRLGEPEFKIVQKLCDCKTPELFKLKQPFRGYRFGLFDLK